MSIVFFDFNINFGGGPQGTLFLLSRLKESGYDVLILDAYGKNKDYKKKADEYSLRFKVLLPNGKKNFIGGKGYKRFFSFFLQIPSLLIILLRLYFAIRKERPKVVIVNNDKSLYLLTLVNRIINFKIILYYRGEAINSQLYPGFIKRLNNNTDAIITHSVKAYDNLIKIVISQEKVCFTHNCIDFESVKSFSINNDFPLSDNFILLLAAARPVKEKGHHIAIQAVAKLKNEGVNVDLVIPGAIPVGDSDEYYLYLKDLIKFHSLEDNVKFIGWRNNFIGDLVQSNGVVLPSHTEGFPRSIIEAMYLGVPVCATPVGGIPEAIQHNNTGLLFDIDDVEQLSRCIRTLVQCESLRNEIVRHAKIFSTDYFDPKHNTFDMINLLIRLSK